MTSEIRAALFYFIGIPYVVSIVVFAILYFSELPFESAVQSLFIGLIAGATVAFYAELIHIYGEQSGGSFF